MKLYRKIFGPGCLLTALFVSASLAAQNAPSFSIPQFSSDFSLVNARMGKEQPMNGKMFSNGNKIRIDMTVHGQEVSTILDRKNQTSDVLMHAQKMYLESNLQADAAGAYLPKLEAYDPDNPCAAQKDYTCKKIGTETINGRVCDKWLFTGSNGDQTVWIDQKLHLPVRTEQADGSSFEMKNIQEGAQPSGTFEIPAGYHKVDAAGMGAMMNRR